MSVTNTKDTRDFEAGMTILELLVVIAIISLAAALVLPRTGSGAERVALRSAAIQLAAGLRAARTEAMSASTESALTIDIGQRRYWASGAVKARSLPRGISIVTGSSAGKPLAVSRAAIRFRPDGSAYGGWIGLRSRSEAASITVDWLTGATHLEWTR